MLKQRLSTLSHVHPSTTVPISTSSATTLNPSNSIQNAYTNCLSNLKQFDKSSYILSAYIPEPVRGTFVALKSLQIELSKIQRDNSSSSFNSNSNNGIMGAMGITGVDLKLKFWQDTINDVFNPRDKLTKEPISLIFKHSLDQGFNLNQDSLNQILNTKQHMISQSTVIRTIDDMKSYGEGYFSQFNYLLQDLLLSEQLSPSTISLVESSEKIRDLMRDIMAHLGQGYGIASLIMSIKYHGLRNECWLPIDIMNHLEVSQEDLLRLVQGHEVNDDGVSSRLRDVVYEVSITSNDHLLSARYKLGELKSEVENVLKNSNDLNLIKKSKNWKNGIPDCLFVPFMNALPLVGYLKQLEKNDFDILGKKIENSYWKLVWGSYNSYKKREI